MSESNLIGRRARGWCHGPNPKYDADKAKAADYRDHAVNPQNMMLPVDGEIVFIHVYETSVYAWLLDLEYRLRRCDFTNLVVLPPDYVGELR